MSDRALRVAVAVLAAAGAGIAAYLTYVKLRGIAPVCTSGGCAKVERSSYAELAGIPTAAFGLAAYAAIFVSALSRNDVARAAGAAVALGGLAYSVYLLYVQLAVIDAICVWCLASDGVLTVLAIATLLRLRASSPG